MNDDKRKLYRMLAVLSTVGMVIVFATVIGVYIGFKLDEWFGTSPWLTLLFFLFGLIAGFKNLFTYAKKSMERFDKDGDKNND
jgi:ATP synthase protein I